MHSGLSPANRLLKRVFDIVVSSVGLLVLWPLLLLGWIAAAASTRANGFFVQKRVGMHGRTFKLLKLRSMRNRADVQTTVTTRQDPRITRIGSLLRKTKMDELPQLWNVLVGDMSLVGPRPDVPGFADKLTGDDLIVLSIRPGITGPASLEFRDEEELLAKQEDPEKYNREVIWPRKVELNRAYVIQYSFWMDLVYIWRTVARI
ncbi:MAG: sugar transferase [Pirellulaceae bacterium]|nr:sugar transferase [Pirellulaceae bacterium]